MESSRTLVLREELDRMLRVVGEFVDVAEDSARSCGALTRLAELVEAEAAILLRQGPDGAEPLVICSQAGNRRSPARARPALAIEVLSRDPGRGRAGSVRILSDLCDARERRTMALHRGLEAWPIRDVAVIQLDSDGATALELQFPTLFPESRFAVLSSLAGLLASLWERRGPRPSTLRPAASVRSSAILSDDNPLGLSRAEYRVCLLVREGQRAAEIAAALSVRECTVRTHLRSIYAKADVSGQVALMHLLGRDGIAGGG